MKASATGGSTSKMAHGSNPSKKGGKAKSKSGKSSKSARDDQRSERGNGGMNAAGLLARSKNAVSDAYDWAADSAERVMPDRSSFQTMMAEKPFVVGAVGLGIGAVIGMLLPDRLTESLSLPKKRSGRK